MSEIVIERQRCLSLFKPQSLIVAQGLNHMINEIKQAEILYGLVFDDQKTSNTVEEIKQQHPHDGFTDEQIKNEYLKILNSHLLVGMPLTQELFLSLLKSHFETICIKNQIE